MNSSDLIQSAERVVQKTIAALPLQIRKAMRDVPVLIERAPSPLDIAAGIEPDTLGYFDESIEGMPKIRLWVDCINEIAKNDLMVFEKEVQTTLLHEIGHLLGWNENDLEARGLE